MTALAYSCNEEVKEKGYLLYNMDDDIKEQIRDEMIIIFEGALELYLTMDAGTELTLEVLPTGSIINPHNMLSNRKHSVNMRFMKPTTFYYLKYSKIVEVARKYPSFSQVLLRQKGKADANKARDQVPIDYIRGYQTFEDCHNHAHVGDQAIRVFKALNVFKNSVLFYTLKNRRDRKVKNLKKILEEYVAKRNRSKDFAKAKKRELDALPLAKRLEKLVADDKILTELQFDNIKETV